METIADVIKRIAEKTKRVKRCEACGQYYDVNSWHDCPKESR